MQESTIVPIRALSEDVQQYISLLEQSEGTTRDKDGNGSSDRVLAYASSGPLAMTSLVNVRNSLDSDTNYAKMSKARKYSNQVSLINRLSHWRASLWGRGFQIVHPHKTVEQAYRNLADRFNLRLSIPELMLDLSIVKNACLIWAQAEGSADLSYLKVYHPESTRIEILTDTLWIEPGKEIRDEITSASDSQKKAYLKRFKPNARKNAEKMWKNIRDARYVGKYPGFVPLREDDKEYWQLILGSGGTSRQAYNSVSMQSIFTDIELLQMLVDGDWATAFLLKNMIMVVKIGEAINSGPLAGSRRNWAKAADVANIKKEIEKTGKAQILYANHTIQIEFAHPEPSVFSPEKYDAVIDRICTYFGIGQFMILGTSTGSSSGASYAAASWNVQEIRIEARQQREIVNENLKNFYAHPAILAAAFIHDKDIYWHDCFASIDGQMLKFKDADFKNLSKANIGVLQYSTDGFGTVREFAVQDVLVDVSALVLGKKIPTDAEPEQFRLFMTPNQIIDLLGPPKNIFDERGLKEDRQVLNEVTFAKGEGIISYMTAAQELGWYFDEQVAQKKRELEIPELLVPLFEKNQGMAMAILANALDIGMDMVDSQNGAPGESGRPRTQPEGQQDTNEHPRPSTASFIDPLDFSAMSDEELAELKIAVWKSLKNVPARLKTLHNVKLTLSQINAIARHAEGAEGGGAESGWGVARKYFLDTHHIEGGRWVKNKIKK